MRKAETVLDPSMDELLASIRRAITEDIERSDHEMSGDSSFEQPPPLRGRSADIPPPIQMPMDVRHKPVDRKVASERQKGFADLLGGRTDPVSHRNDAATHNNRGPDRATLEARIADRNARESLRATLEDHEAHRARNHDPHWSREHNTDEILRQDFRASSPQRPIPSVDRWQQNAPAALPPRMDLSGFDQPYRDDPSADYLHTDHHPGHQPEAPRMSLPRTMAPLAAVPGSTPSMLSASAMDAASSSFNQLTETVMSDAMSEDSLKELTAGVMRPLLKQWLDMNLPALVERLVREEIERVARRGPAR